MSRHPELGAGHPDNVDDRGDADFVCDGPCARTIYSGLLTRIDGKLLCGDCALLPENLEKWLGTRTPTFRQIEEAS